MRKILFLILLIPAVVFANGEGRSSTTSLEFDNSARMEYYVRKSAELVFKTNYERNTELFNRLLVDQPNDNRDELRFKQDSRRMIVEISQWQIKNGKNNSGSYVDQVIFGGGGTDALNWSFRCRDLLIVLASRIKAAPPQVEQPQQNAPADSGGGPATYRLPLFN